MVYCKFLISVSQNSELVKPFTRLYLYRFLLLYSGKQIVSGDLRIFSSNKSFLFKKRMIEVSPNHLLLQMESNSFRLSCMRFWKIREINYKKIFKLFSMRYCTMKCGVGPEVTISWDRESRLVCSTVSCDL